MRQRLAVALAAVLVVAAAGMAAASFSSAKSASFSVSSATLDAPGSMTCTSSLNIFTPITFTWTKPTALTGKATGPLSYTIERRANSGAWSTIASGVTTTSYSDNPSALLGLGTVWQYRVTAVYGNWTSPVSTSVSGTYGLLSLVTVLTSCA